MTGLENYMTGNGWTLTHGKSSEWNTYDNCNRSWLHTNGKRVLIGLYAKPTRVGLLLPMLTEFIDGEHKPVDHLPSGNYKEWLDKYILK